jgi:hypothetical protein
MSENSVVEALENADLHDRLIVLIDYHAHARRLTLRIARRGEGEAGAGLTQTLMFDGVYGLHCDPQDALAPLDGADDVAEILVFEARERADGSGEVKLVFLRPDKATGRDDTKVVTFRAFGARWRD